MRTAQYVTVLFIGMGLTPNLVQSQFPAIATAAESGAQPLKIGDKVQLLVDDFLIDEKRNVTRQQGPVTKLGPVFKPESELDGSISWGFYHTVLFNPHEEKFQLWYNVGVGAQIEGIAYAESENGVEWTRPLVSNDGRLKVVLPTTGHSVTLDPTVPWGHKEKFKAVWMTRVSRATLAFSADGVHWNPGKRATPANGSREEIRDDTSLNVCQPEVAAVVACRSWCDTGFSTACMPNSSVAP